MRLPFAPQRAVKRGIVLARFFGHGVAQVRFDRALIFAHAIDARVHVKVLEQFAKIEIAAAGPCDGRAAERIYPDFAGMAGQEQRIIGIGGREAQHRLVRRANAVDRFANILQMDLPTAQKTVEIEHHGGDALVPRRRVQRADEIAGLIFANWRAARKQRLERVDRGAFFHHHAVEREHERAFAHLCRAGPRGQHRVEREEEQVEHPLHADDHRALEPGGLRDLDEGHQVHALVFGFVHERLDPALVVAHAAQTGEMVNRCPNHTRHGRHRLEHDGTVAVTLGKESIGTPAQRLGETEGNPVRHSAGVVVNAQIDEGCCH